MPASDSRTETEGEPSWCKVYLGEHLDSIPARKSLIVGPRPLTYGDLAARIPRIGALLASFAIGQGDRVVVLSANDSATATLFLGLIAHGVTAVMLDPDAPAEELRALLDAADAAAVFADEDLVRTPPLLAASEAGVRVVPVRDEPRRASVTSMFRRGGEIADADGYPAILERFRSSSTSLPDVDEDTIAYILFTSGTTSRPKGVQISHRSLFAQMHTFVRHYGLDAESKVLNILPLHHTDGLTHGVVMAMVAGASVHRPMKFSLERLPELLDLHYRERISHLVTVPSLLSLMRELGEDYRDSFDYPEFRFVVSTASYLAEGLWSDFQSIFGVRVVNVYGLTETVCEACYCGPDDDSYRIGTVGKPVDCEAAVMDDLGKPVPVGTTGELALRGDNVMSGYFRMPQETSAVMRDGWFMTGDLATLDEDGFVRIVGRKKSVIVTGGHNVYPEDVANVLRSLDGVRDAFVFGVDDAIWGERAVALVVPDGRRHLEIDRLSAEFLERASREKLPRDMHVVADLPRGPSGKVVLAEAQRMALGLNGKADAADGADVETTVYEIAARTFKVNRSDLGPASSTSNTPGWDSLSHVEFLLSLESAYRIQLEVRDIMNIVTVQQAVDVVESRRAANG